jgi:hypothetical protein
VGEEQDSAFRSQKSGVRCQNEELLLSAFCFLTSVEALAPNHPPSPPGLMGEKHRGHHRTTRKGTLLRSVRLGVTTSTGPVVAPAGTVVVIKELETTLKTAAWPLNLTLIAPIRLVPRILTASPTLPEVGCVFTNGPRPTDRLKTVPSPLAPPLGVVP